MPIINRLRSLICFFLLMGLLLGGCSANWGQPVLGRYTYTRVGGYGGREAVRVIPIWIDKNFGESDRLAIDDAIYAWNYALNGYIKLVVVDINFDMEESKIIQQIREDGWLFLKIKKDSSLIPSKSGGYVTVAFTDRVGGHHLYIIRDRLRNEDVFGVTLHEIGHLMGSDHVGDRLMYPHFTRARYRCIDRGTIDVVAQYQNLPADKLNFCMDKDMSVVVKNDEINSSSSIISCPVE